MYNLPPTAILFSIDRHGIYIPQYFAESIVSECLTSVNPDDMAILRAGPEHPEYWDAWCDVECNAIVIDPETGIQYRLYQDGDLWLVPCDWNPEESE